MASSLTQEMVVTSAAQDAKALRQILQSVTPRTCPHTYNFHMHTTASDGRLDPEELVKQAMELGLSGFAITDHHSVAGFQVAHRWLEEYRNWYQVEVPRLWVGAEFNADLCGTEVHILGYAFNPNHEAMQPYLQQEVTTGEAFQAKQVIRSVKQAGGLVVLAHPARYRVSASALVPKAAELGVDGVESYYAYHNPSPWQPSPRQTQEVWLLGEAHGLLHTCGTDTHGLSLLQRL